MTEYPLLFTFREIVEGPGFVAGVVCDGRALMVNVGEDGWHVSGVQPGALSEMGDAPHEAYFYFRRAFSDSLRVLASGAPTFESFELSVRAFFAQDDEEARRWDAARAAVRAGAEPDGPFLELPLEKAEAPRGLQVVRLDYQKPNDQTAAARTLAQQEQVGIATHRRVA